MENLVQSVSPDRGNFPQNIHVDGYEFTFVCNRSSLNSDKSLLLQHEVCCCC
jgi:hypothetical protein